MLSPYIQSLLSVLHEKSPDFEPVFGGGTKSSGRNPLYQKTHTALGYVSKRDPLAASLLSSIYLDTPDASFKDVLKQDRLHQDFTDPAIKKAVIRLALIELNSLLGSNRCGCGGRNKTCDMCSGTGIRPNRAFSERARVSLLQKQYEGMTRYRWRSDYAEAYDKLLDGLLERLSVGALLFRAAVQ